MHRRCRRFRPPHPGFVLLLCSIAAAADAESAKRFAGTWEAQHHDITYCILKIDSAGENVTGTMNVGQIDSDDDGNLRTVGPVSADDHPLIKPHLEGDKLQFGWSDEPNEEALQFEMTVTAPGKAELRFLSTPENVKIKPLKLRNNG